MKKTKIIGAESHVIRETKTEKELFRAFIQRIRNDSRFSGALLEVFVENNLSQVAASTFFGYMDGFEPFLFAMREDTRGERTHGVLTTNETKLEGHGICYFMLQNDLMLFMDGMICSEPLKIKELLKQQLSSYIIEEKPKQGTQEMKYVLHGKINGKQDDLATVLQMTMTYRRVWALKPEHYNLIPSRFAASYRTRS
jgi:hypothetical protein